MKRRFFLAGIGAVAAAVALSCGGNNNGPTKTGTLSVMLKDTPFSDAKAVLVTFTEVRVHVSDAEWSTLPFAGGATSRTCDLKKLTSAVDVLGTGPLAAKHYTQLRLTVSNASINFDNPSAGEACAAAIAAPDGTNAPVTVSSGEVKLVRQFEVKEGGATTILLDFDGAQSITRQGTGDYRMSPVIKVVSVQ